MMEAESSTAAAATRQDSSNKRSCWVCFATEDEAPTAVWLKPCRCRGSTKWVHETCLNRWIDEKQKGNSFAKVSCAQCGTDYIVVYPPLGYVLRLLERIDRLVLKACPILTGGVVLGSIYWTAVTYGAITLMEMMGHKEAIRSMEDAEPALLLIGLPTIPIMLIVVKMIRWEESVVIFLRHLHHQRGIRGIFNGLLLGRQLPPVPEAGMDGGVREGVAVNLAVQQPPIRDGANATRTLIGALALPTISMICGKWFFSSMTHLTPLKRHLLGGLSFLAVKGMLKIYFKYYQQIRKSQRRILDFDHKSVGSQAGPGGPQDQEEGEGGPTERAHASTSTTPPEEIGEEELEPEDDFAAYSDSDSVGRAVDSELHDDVTQDAVTQLEGEDQ